MQTEMISIPSKEYQLLKKKESLANDLLLQLESSLQDLKNGKVKKVR